MAVNMFQQTHGRGGLIRSGSTTFRSNDNNNDVLVLDQDRGAIANPAVSVIHFDDFLGDVLEDGYSGAGGSDAQALAPAINAQAGGVVRLVAGDAAGTDDAADASVLTHGLNWKANQGGLYLEARVKAVTTAALIGINVGFTDVLGTSTVEEPFSISGTTVTSNATDAVCFVFDTSATNDTWHIQGVKDDTDTAINNTGVGLTADEWVKLAIAIDASGNAEFFINDTSYGTVADAVTPTVALTPVIEVMSRSAASKTLDADYLLIAASRT